MAASSVDLSWLPGVIKLTFDPLGVALQGLANVAQGLDKAFSGLFSSLASRVGDFLSPITKGIGANLTDFFDSTFGKIVGNAAQGFAQAVGGMASALSGIVTGASELGKLVEMLVEAVDPGLAEQIGMALRELAATLGVALQPLGQVLVDVLRDIAGALDPLMRALAPILGELAQILADILIPIVMLLSETLQLLLPAIRIVVKAFHALVDALKWLIGKITGIDLDARPARTGNAVMQSSIMGLEQISKMLAQNAYRAAGGRTTAEQQLEVERQIEVNTRPNRIRDDWDWRGIDPDRDINPENDPQWRPFLPR